MSLVCSPARAGTRPSPSPKITPWGHFWKPALGDLRLDEKDIASSLRQHRAINARFSRSEGGRRRNYQGRFRRRGGRPVISVRRIVPAPVQRARRRSRHAVRAGQRANLRLRFPGSARADSAYENILFFASACRSGRTRRASRRRRCHGSPGDPGTG